MHVRKDLKSPPWSQNEMKSKSIGIINHVPAKHHVTSSTLLFFMNGTIAHFSSSSSHVEPLIINHFMDPWRKNNESLITKHTQTTSSSFSCNPFLISSSCWSDEAYPFSIDDAQTPLTKHISHFISFHGSLIDFRRSDYWSFGEVCLWQSIILCIFDLVSLSVVCIWCALTVCIWYLMWCAF